jgi:hypothetical protein
MPGLSFYGIGLIHLLGSIQGGNIDPAAADRRRYAVNLPVG